MHLLRYMTITLLISFYIVPICWSTDPCKSYINKLGYEPQEIKAIDDLIKKARKYGRQLSHASISTYEKDITDFLELIRLSKQYDCGMAKINKVIYRLDGVGKVIALFSRAEFYFKTGNYKKAKKDYDEMREKMQGLLMTPNIAYSAYCNFSWFLSTCPDSDFRDGKRAIEMIQKVHYEYVTREAAYRCLSASAAAFAEIGNFEIAIKNQKKAIEYLQPYARDVSPDKNDWKLKALKDLQIEYNNQLNNYKVNRPWRESFKK